MGDHNIVVTVRLSDVSETEQPDPICLPADELGATWRHFETLLISMYREPPSAIQVFYLDDESDWICINSETEFQEAIKIAQRTDEILQLKVKRKDTQQPVYYTSTLPDPRATNQAQPNNHLHPLHTTYYNQQQQQQQQIYINTKSDHKDNEDRPLVYPLPQNSTNITTNTSYPLACNPFYVPTSSAPMYTAQPVQYASQPLSYPQYLTTFTSAPTVIHYPSTTTEAQSHSNVQQHNRNENVLVLGANGKSASIQNRPDLSTDDKVKRLKSMLNGGGEGSIKDEGLNSLLDSSSRREVRKEASKFSTQDKVKFMKATMVDGKSVCMQKSTEKAVSNTSGKEGKSVACYQPALSFENLPCSNETQTAGYSLTEQDPFEVVSLSLPQRPSDDLKQLQVDGMLTPQKKTDIATTAKSTNDKTKNTLSLSNGTKIEMPVIEQPRRNDTNSAPCSSFNRALTFYDNCLIRRPPELSPHVAPVLTPQSSVMAAFPMMEGAQSGANAVAIDIPDGEHHGAASGGAACLSASAETGEITGYSSGLEGAAVRDKSTSTSSSIGAAYNKKVKKAEKKASKSKHKEEKDAKKKKSKEKELSKIKSSKKEKKQEGIKVEEDVESGEKVLKTKHHSALQTKEFIKIMNKIQMDLHSSIVRDVGQETRSLLNRQLTRSVSCSPGMIFCESGDSSLAVHRGIYCDVCNTAIRGIRYKCGNCDDYDLCERCESIDEVNHNPSHVFLKLRRPVAGAGKDGPLLREVIYQDETDCILDRPDSSEVSNQSLLPLLPKGKQLSQTTKENTINEWLLDQQNLKERNNEYFSFDDHLSEPIEITKTAIDGDVLIEKIVAEVIERGEACGSQNACDIVKDEMSENTLDSDEPKIMQEENDKENVNDDDQKEDEEKKEGNEETDDKKEEANEKKEVDEEKQDEIEKRDDDEDGNESSVVEDDDSDFSAEFVKEEVMEDFEELDVDDDEEEEANPIVEVLTELTHDTDSDSSDDFCVLDPPSSASSSQMEEVSKKDEIEGSQRSQLQHSLDVPSSEIVNHVRAEGEACIIDITNSTTEEMSTLDNSDNLNAETQAAMEDMMQPIEEMEIAKSPQSVEVVDEEIVRNNINDNEKLEMSARENDKLITADAEIDYDISEKNGSIDDQGTEGDEMKFVEREMEEKEIEDKEGKENVDVSKDKDEKVDAAKGVEEDDILMNMSSEERIRFMEMVKSLKDRAEDLEKELKSRKEAEEKELQAKEREDEYSSILQEKEREAARQNDELSEQLRKAETHAKRSRVRKTKSSPSSTFGSNPTLMQMALGGAKVASSSNSNTKNSKKGSTVTTRSKATSPMKSAGKAVRVLDTKDAGKVKVSQATYTRTASGLPNVIVMTKDADCQTAVQEAPKLHASHVIHSVATGMTKAAGAAFYTAKDVFYSLQAKQVDKKSNKGKILTKTNESSEACNQKEADRTVPSPFSVWTPPADTFIPPKSEWTPPKSDWKPKESTWTPKNSEWTGPKSEWTPPAGFYQEPTRDVADGTEQPLALATSMDKTNTSQVSSGDGSKVKQDEKRSKENSGKAEGNIKNVPASVPSMTTPLPLMPPLEIADSALRREVQGMQLLMEMGFANREQNRKLLREFDGDVEKVVQSLLQEEREDHWSWHRH